MESFDIDKRTKSVNGLERKTCSNRLEPAQENSIELTVKHRYNKVYMNLLSFSSGIVEFYNAFRCVGMFLHLSL